MDLQLIKASVDDSEKIYEMQILAFKALLEKYNDYNTNPGAETLEKVKSRFLYDIVDHYLIFLHDKIIGYIRVQRLNETSCKLSQMFILPSFQGNGYAQAAIRQAELLYPDAKSWVLDTIKQEPKLCHIYEKMGFKLTGAEKNIKYGMDLVDYAK